MIEDEVSSDSEHKTKVAKHANFHRDLIFDQVVSTLFYCMLSGDSHAQADRNITTSPVVATLGVL